ncbi:MAG: bifunctional hydroxymethylpyrimidine kinase/phosphomethylpyrimidine kinase [Atopobiaceae bacterium]|jgi:pyridoxine kinase|nr:bifunctional hydroxymethylpyrimidine kinase/phosphomethylpyrimidine kinase [Atopobiaceae bacterium]MCI2173632.1 bifunctional hydroxymethylpyrimidine kinase/phosphomethylpyrimidine kinase [Atopobiaceae bacterium]MCI2207726.1 bifunctional hydroxymethylpyrimidine kinase/phosphomethylpyrimidine kinase [Atopobiaceae bacterium]
MTHASELYLYKRSGSYIPRVAAVHDLCGYGKCSLGVAIPVLSAAGCDVCPVPTSLFSAHTRFPEFYMHDTTDMLSDYLDAWVKEGIELDAVYSGFLGAAEQVASIQRLYREHPKALRIVDPVMGDGGQMYPTYTPELCHAMSDLVDGADVLTPNLTEASILTGIDYSGQDVDDDFVGRNIDALLSMGAKSVVLKGIVRGDGLIRNYVAVPGGDVEEVSATLLPFMLHGTGDLYASGLLSAIMCGRDLRSAVEFAGGLVTDAMKVTREQPDYEVRGVSFESVLGDVTDLLR